MCDFASWIEYEEQVYFLKNSDLTTTAGEKLLQPAVVADLCGHGAIRAYLGVGKKWGKNRECTDFSTPDNFPLEIAESIKTGQLSRFGRPTKILNRVGYRKYDAACKPAGKKYEAARAGAWKIRDAAVKPAGKIYDAACNNAWKIYDAAINPAREIFEDAIVAARGTYEAAVSGAREIYDAAEKHAREIYEAAEKHAREIYDAAEITAFSEIVRDEKNRVKKWK